MLTLLNQELPEKKRLLIVEDDEILVEILKNYAKNFFDEIYFFETAEKALTFLESKDIMFDCSLIDFFLPGQNGDAIVKELKDRCSGGLYMMSGDLERAYQSSMIDHLTGVIQKPLSLEKIHKLFNGKV